VLSVAGTAVPHTILLIAETSADPPPTIRPFEYFFLCLFAIPGLLGAAAARFAGQAWRAGARGEV